MKHITTFLFAIALPLVAAAQHNSFDLHVGGNYTLKPTGDQLLRNLYTDGGAGYNFSASYTRHFKIIDIGLMVGASQLNVQYDSDVLKFEQHFNANTSGQPYNTTETFGERKVTLANPIITTALMIGKSWKMGNNELSATVLGGYSFTQGGTFRFGDVAVPVRDFNAITVGLCPQYARYIVPKVAITIQPVYMAYFTSDNFWVRNATIHSLQLNIGAKLRL